MKSVRLLGTLTALLIFVPLAKADSMVNMQFTGVNGANDGQYYVSPYTGSMNGQTVVLFCDDILNDVNFNQTWTANVTNLATAVDTNNFSKTRYGGVSTSAVYSNPALAYEQAAWLVTQFASNPDDLVNLQYALWDIMNPGARGGDNSDVQNWLLLASQNYGQINLNDFAIVTNTGRLALTGQVQEFIIQTPEPGTLALLFCGLLAFAVRLLHRRQLTT
ncbi:MAG TPA: PEP-CTERM sorting domain-containing protein [Candidatus Eisenbacteria bacterium]|nr:PEP-CTERM sorting domain-containing protein [Candidatus Eisenbacteria bacterium]